MKFPKKVYMKIVGKPDEEYFDVHRFIDSTVDAGERAKLGVYELREVVEAQGSVTVVTAKPVKKRR